MVGQDTPLQTQMGNVMDCYRQRTAEKRPITERTAETTAGGILPVKTAVNVLRQTMCC